MDQSTDELKRGIEATRANLSGTIEAIGDRVSPSRIVERRRNAVINSAQSLRERVMGSTHDATDAVSSTAADAAGALKDMPGAVTQRTQGAPMIAGAIAFGIGFLIAAALPASDTEKAATTQLLEKLEPVKQDLTDTASDIVEHLKEPATQAATAVKDAATDAADTVASSAKQAVGDTQQQATESIAAVKSGTGTPE